MEIFYSGHVRAHLPLYPLVLLVGLTVIKRIKLEEKEDFSLSFNTILTRLRVADRSNF